MIVYLVTNLANGKRYIGATKNSLPRRRGKHFWDAENRPYCRIFHAALRKYGAASFRWDVLVRCSTAEELEREEIRLISEMSPEYNITIGGRGLGVMLRTPEWLAKMSASAKIVAAKRTDEERAARRLDLERGRERWKKPVLCLTDGSRFASIADAARFYGVTHAGICAVLRGDQRVTKGLSFAAGT